jgi:hypothetical protein
LGYPMGFEPTLSEPQPEVLTADTTNTIGRGCKDRTYDLGIKIRCDTISPIPN